MLFWYAPVNASRRVEFHQTQWQTQAAAKLKQGQFIRIRTASGKRISGHFVSFDGSRLVLEDRRNHSSITVDSGEVAEIKSGRGFWGALQNGLSGPAQILARPLTDTIRAYQMMEALGHLMG
jgi:hypothetical protein